MANATDCPYNRFGIKRGDVDDDYAKAAAVNPSSNTARTLSSQQLSLLRSLPCNDVCVECDVSNPDWARCVVVCMRIFGVSVL